MKFYKGKFMQKNTPKVVKYKDMLSSFRNPQPQIAGSYEYVLEKYSYMLELFLDSSVDIHCRLLEKGYWATCS